MRNGPKIVLGVSGVSDRFCPGRGEAVGKWFGELSLDGQLGQVDL